MKRCLGILFLSLFVAFINITMSCTEAELCPEPLDEHPHYAHVSYSFNWDSLGVDESLNHDSMYVLAYRVINIWKSSMVVSSFDRPSRGRYLYNMLEERLKPVVVDTTVVDSVVQDSTAIDSVAVDSVTADTDSVESIVDDAILSEESFRLKSGDYKFVAFSRNDLEIDYSSVDNYLCHDEVPLSDMNVIYKTYEKGDPALHFTIADWVDYNAYGDKDRYMQPSLQPIYYDTIAVRSLRANGRYHIEFANPRRLTQHIEIHFEIRKVAGSQPFTVDSVFAEISGIPYVINLATGYIDIQKTKKMMFKAEHNKDSVENQLVRCKGVIDVPTIVESSSEDIFMGPGIMQVMIMCSTQDSSDPTKRLNKKFQGSINLYHTLKRGNLMRYTDDRQHVTKRKDSAELVIDAVMRINGEHIIENPDDAAGLDRWHKEGKNPPIIDI